MKIYLYLYTEDGTRTLHLDGASVAAPIKGALYRPGVGVVGLSYGRETINEELKISVAGTRVQIQTALDTLSELLDFAEQKTLSDYDKLYIRVEYDDVGVTWQSEIIEGEVIGNRSGIATREFGTDVLTLEIKRLNFWEETAGEALLLTNENGTKQTTITTWNHTDATSGHNNYIDLSKDDIPGDLPAPIELNILHNDSGRTVSQLWAAQLETTGTLPTAKPIYEGELAAAGSATTLTSTADANSSAGYFGRLAFTGGSEQRVVSFEISYAQMSLFRGKYYKPFIRLANNHAYTDLWLKVKVTYGASHSVAYDSGWVQSLASIPYVEFNSVKLPPYPAKTNYHGTMYISIYAMKTASGAVTLDVDFLHLLPTDGYNRLDMIEAIAAGYNIKEGETVGSYKWSNSTLFALPSHSRVGKSLYVTPGMNTRFFLLHRSGANMPIDTTFTISMFLYKRRKYL